MHVDAACPSSDRPADSARCTRRACRCRWCRGRTRVQPCAFFSSCVLSQIFVSNQPSTPAGPNDDHSTSLLSKFRWPHAEAGVDRRHLSSSSGRTSAAAALALVDREQPSPTDDPIRRWHQAGVCGSADARRGPHAALLVHREAVRAWSGCSRSLRRPSTATARPAAVRRARRLRIAHGQLDLARACCVFGSTTGR